MAAIQCRLFGRGIDNFKIDGKRITADVKQYDPVIFKWMAFLTGYVLPKAYFEKVGPQEFEKKPIGTGPYMVDAYEGNAYLRLKANPKYWGGKPAFETVVFKFVPDATSRVAEIESGSSDVTLEVPYEEYDRLKTKAGLKGVCTPISDIGMIFITNGGVMDDKNVRLAMCSRRRQRYDHQASAARLRRADRHARSAGIRGLRSDDQSAVRPGDGDQAARCQRLLEGEAGQVHHPDDARLQAEGLRNDPGDRRHVAQCRHRRQHRDLRDRQALRAAHVAQTGAGGVLQLGQRHRRSDHVHRLRDVLASRRTRRGTPTISTPRSGRCGAKRTRKSASRAGRTSTATSPKMPMCCRSCNMRSRSSTSPISKLPRTSPARCSRRRWSRRRKTNVEAVRRRAGARRPSTRSVKDRSC